MRIQANPSAAAPAKSGRTPHAPAMKSTAVPAAAKPETYAGAGSLLDAEA